MITLKEAKNYLRVDYEEDDSLIQNLLSTAKNGSFANVGVGENNAVSGRIKCVQHSEKFS